MGGGQAMIMSIPEGKAYVNSAGVMVLASMGGRVSHSTVACSGRRRGCRLCSRLSLRVVAVCDSVSVSAHVYDAMAWPIFSTASSLEASPPA